MRFNRVNIASLLFLGPCQVVALRIELSATWLSAAFGPPALGYRNFSRDGRTRTCDSVLPKHVGSPLPYIPSSYPVRTGGFEPPISWPPTRRDTQASLRSATSGSCGSRTRLCALKGRDPRSDRRTSRALRAPSTQLRQRGSAHFSRSGSGGARIRVSWSSARRYTISATDPNEKSPMSL